MTSSLNQDVATNGTTLSNSTLLSRDSARSVLLTVLGELVWQSDNPAKTSSLIYVMKQLGFGEATSRQAILRGADAGWLQSQKHGREVSWTLAPALEQVFEEGSRRVAELSNPVLDWNHKWLVLFITIPQSHRSQRKRLYRDLTWAGFGNPTSGVWLSPHTERREQVRQIIERLDLVQFVMSFTGETDTVGMSDAEIIRQGWELESLAEDYAKVYREFRDPQPQTENERLVTTLRASGQLQRFPFADPQLPSALLPDWIGREVATHIQNLRTKWASAIRERWAEIND